MLSLRNITLTFPDGQSRVTALNNVSLDVQDGEAVGITGPSGSGKSSLLAVASTLVTPDHGEIRIGQRDASKLGRKEAAKIRRDELGIVFQSPNLIPSLKIREQLEVMAKLGAGNLRDLSKDELRDRIDETLESVGIADLADRIPQQLSGGQRQRTNIARAIVHRPSALLVDEPTSALDKARGDAIIELLVGLTHDLGLATVVVTHEIEHLENFDSSYRMLDGELSLYSEEKAGAAAPSARHAA